MLTIYDNANKIQARKMAWMREPEWKWYIVHTDWMNSLMPVWEFQKFVFWINTSIENHAFSGMNLGCPMFDNRANGPND